MTFLEDYHGVTWSLEPRSVDSKNITFRVPTRDHTMVASYLDFSLREARCVQLPDWLLSLETIEALDDWLKQRKSGWKLHHKKPMKKPPKPRASHPRQLKLPGVE